VEADVPKQSQVHIGCVRPKTNDAAVVYTDTKCVTTTNYYDNNFAAHTSVKLDKNY